jgi:hypothetical protein
MQKNREEDWFEFQRAILAVFLAECERRGSPAPEAIISGEDAVYRARQIVAWFSDKDHCTSVLKKPSPELKGE